MEEEKKEVKEKKGTDFTTLLCFSVIIIVTVGALLGYSISANRKNTVELRKRKNSDITNVEIEKEKEVIEDEDRFDEEEIDVDYTADDEIILISDENEVDYGNKIDNTKSYVYSIEYDKKEHVGGFQKFYIPFINIDSDQIKKINEEIQEIYDSIESENARIEDIYYYCYIDDDLLDLSIWYGYDDCFTRKGYHIDIVNEKEISNSEFLKKLDIDDEKLKLLIEDAFYEDYHTTPSFGDLEINSLDEFINETYFVGKNEPNKEKYKYNYEKICNNCDMYVTGDNTVYIKGICTPTLYESCESNEGIVINIVRNH